MARPKLPTNLPPEQPPHELAAIETIHEIRAERDGQRIRDIALIEAQYGDGLPYDQYRLEARGSDIKGVMSGQAWELGCIFMRIRAHVEPGEFHASLERMGYAPRWARACMQAVRKFSASPQRQQLAQKLAQSKLLELLSENDDALDGLEDGGTVAGLTLDEIDRMSVRELRATLRTERAARNDEKAAEADIVRRKDERINALMRDKRRVERSAAREQAGELLEQLDRVSVEVATNVKTLRDTASAIRAVYEEAGEAMDEEVADRLQQCGDLAAKWTGQLADELGE